MYWSTDKDSCCEESLQRVLKLQKRAAEELF